MTLPIPGSHGHLLNVSMPNEGLRRAVSDLTLDKLILSEAARGNF